MRGDYIGNDGTTADGNGEDGVVIDSGSSNNTIGGATSAARDVISGNEGNGVDITGASHNVVEGDYIGTEGTGAAAVPNSGFGVELTASASDNTIGGTSSGARDVISGNGYLGVELLGTSGDVVEGDYIGTSAAGTAALANSLGGIGIAGGSSDNTIGGSAASARDMISGNAGNGVFIVEASRNVVEGDYIGTDAAGNHALGNREYGVGIASGATNNTIGGTSAGARDVISASGYGVYITQANKNVVEGDYIGTNAAGTGALANDQAGVGIYDATGNRIGGTATGARDVISGNDIDGVLIEQDGTSENVVEGDYIGTNATGTAALGNGIIDRGGAGVAIDHGASDNTVGGTTSGAADVISGNENGVELVGSGTNGNLIERDYIGTDASSRKLGNVHNGVFIDGGDDNTIGGTSPAARDVISANHNVGVGLVGGAGGTSDNRVENDYIGTNVADTAALGTQDFGVDIDDGASDNTVGGTAADANSIAHNASAGVRVDGSSTTGNPIEHNSIFANGSAHHGILLSNGGDDSEAAPSINSASTTAGKPTISGTVSESGTTLMVEVFVNHSCSDPEGKTFVGTATPSSGKWSLPSTESLTEGEGVTATVTDTSTGNTSEFSSCTPVTS